MTLLDSSQIKLCLTALSAAVLVPGSPDGRRPRLRLAGAEGGAWTLDFFEFPAAPVASWWTRHRQAVPTNEVAVFVGQAVQQVLRAEIRQAAPGLARWHLWRLAQKTFAHWPELTATAASHGPSRLPSTEVTRLMEAHQARPQSSRALTPETWQRYLRWAAGWLPIPRSVLHQAAFALHTRLARTLLILSREQAALGARVRAKIQPLLDLNAPALADAWSDLTPTADLLLQLLEQAEDGLSLSEVIADFVQSRGISLPRLQRRLAQETRRVAQAVRAAENQTPEARLALQRLQAQLAHVQGDAKAATAGYREVLARLHPAFSLGVWKTVSWRLALAWRDFGRPKAAAELWAELLAHERQTSGQPSPAVLHLLCHQARARAQAGERTRALDLLRDARRDFATHLGAEHPLTVDLVHQLALLLPSPEASPEAAKLFPWVWQQRRQTLGALHPQTLAAEADWAACTAELGRLPEALQLARRAFRGRWRTLGPEHPETLASQLQVAHLDATAGHAASAVRLLTHAYSRLSRQLGRTHPETLAVQQHLAVSLRESGALRAAQSHFRRLLALHHRQSGMNHPATLETLNSYANLLAELGYQRTARSLFERALEALPGDADGPLALSLGQNYAAVLCDLGEHSRAEPILRQCLAQRIERQSWSHPDTGMAAFNLACLLRDTGATAEARTWAEHAGAGFQQALGSDHPCSRQAQQLIALLTAENGDQRSPL